MAIPIEKLLEKVYVEAQKAKEAVDESEMREHIRGIQMICELILESQKSDVGAGKPVQPVATKEKSNNFEAANGPSIFDF